MISSPIDSLRAGAAALKQKQFEQAAKHLEDYCNANVGVESNEHFQAQIWLVQSYKAMGRIPEARHLCWILSQASHPKIQSWATEMMTQLPVQIPGRAPVASLGQSALDSTGGDSSTHSAAPVTSPPRKPQRPSRAQAGGVSLAMRGVASNLAGASSITLLALLGMVQALVCALVFISGSSNPALGLLISTAITLIFNLGAFFISPIIMDWVQRGVYSTQWTDLAEIERLSPEAADVIKKICEEKNLKQPRLGIIADQNPTAFTYGSLPNKARLVVSRGLFTYLDDDEVATVYAHELGHIVHWDFAVMTLAATLVQMMYLIYRYANQVARNLGDGDGAKKLRNGLQAAAIAAWIFHSIGEYLILYLSRTREYYADHFAAEVTGNPNGLSRALVKIAYGIVEESKQSEEPSKVLQGMRALGIADARSAGAAGTAYRVAADGDGIGNVFLWDLFNPWGWWMELSSTHPLTGKRVRALSTYAEQLDLKNEFDMARVVRAGNQLDKKRLHRGFAVDVILMGGPTLGALVGLLFGLLLAGATGKILLGISCALVGFALGMLLHGLVMFPSLKQATQTDILTLMSDPYASPLRGRPVKLQGSVIGRGDAGNRFSEDFQFQDSNGMIRLNYVSRFGGLGNFFFGWKQAEKFIAQPAVATGWFRRGMVAHVDLSILESENQGTAKSYPRFGKFAGAGIALGVAVILALIS